MFFVKISSALFRIFIEWGKYRFRNHLVFNAVMQIGCFGVRSLSRKNSLKWPMPFLRLYFMASALDQWTSQINGCWTHGASIFQILCAKAVTSPIATAPVGNPYTATSSMMKILCWGIRAEVCCRWPTLDPIRTVHSSFYARPQRPGWMGNT